MVSYGSLDHVAIDIVFLLKQPGDLIYIPIGQFYDKVDIAGHPRNSIKIRRHRTSDHIGNSDPFQLCGH